MKGGGLRIFLLVLLLLVPPISCGSGGSGGNEGAIRAVATIFPIADLVRNVGGDRVSVTVLLPSGASPHTFDPRPSQLRDLADARVFFEVGAGLELWAEPLARASGNRKLEIVALSEGMDLLYLCDGRPCTETDEHPSGYPNPHVWLDPLNAVRMVERIARVLSEIDPAGASFYARNAGVYSGELHALDETIRQTVAGFETRRYVAFHSAWAYFARRYGLESVGVIEESPGKEATPGHLEEILSAIRANGIRAVFAEPQLNPKAAEVLAREAGVEIAVLDPIGGEKIQDRDSYLGLMRYNLSEMKRVMGQAPGR